MSNQKKQNVSEVVFQASRVLGMIPRYGVYNEIGMIELRKAICAELNVPITEAQANDARGWDDFIAPHIYEMETKISQIKNEHVRIKKPRPYYILVEFRTVKISKTNVSEQWCMEFGDYDRNAVASELTFYKDHAECGKKKNVKMHKLPDAKKKTLEEFMKQLNA